jgi:acetyl esterase/lipase
MISRKNVDYIQPDLAGYHREKHKVDIMLPEKADRSTPVIVFIHGGMWISGSKDPYYRLGDFFSEKGIGVVSVNYRLGLDFREMAYDCARAVAYVAEHVSDNIHLMGHSAGGHLSALAALDSSYTGKKLPVRSCILIDAFGLCLSYYIRHHAAAYLHYIEQVFTRDPDLWEKASPVNFITEASFPFLIYTGSATYPFLRDDNVKFALELGNKNLEFVLSEIRGKSHQEMITQFSDKNTPLYDEIVSFIGQPLKVTNRP